MIIGFCGYAGSGKDYASRMMMELFKPHNVKFYKLADPMKAFCKSIFNWTDDHTDGDLKEIVTPAGFSPRHAMQLLGTEWGRRLYPDCWVNHCLSRIYNDFDGFTPRKTDSGNFFIDRTHVAMVTDVRFPNEAEAILHSGGYLIYIDGGGLSGSTSSHASELAINFLKRYADVIINNQEKDSSKLRNALTQFITDLPRHSSREIPKPLFWQQQNFNPNTQDIF